MHRDIAAAAPERFSDPEAVALMNDARDAGFMVAVLTNDGVGIAGKEFFDSRPEFKALDAFVDAREFDQPKPLAESYLRTARVLGVDPSEIVFLDNTPACVEGARDVGMTACSSTRPTSDRRSTSPASCCGSIPRRGRGGSCGPPSGPTRPRTSTRSCSCSTPRSSSTGTANGWRAGTPRRGSSTSTSWASAATRAGAISGCPSCCGLPRATRSASSGTRRTSLPAARRRTAQAASSGRWPATSSSSGTPTTAVTT